MVISSSLFILATLCHSQQIHGFKIIAHDLHANDIIHNVQKVFQNKTKSSITVYLGPLQKSYEHNSKKQYTAYFERYFETLAHDKT